MKRSVLSIIFGSAVFIGMSQSVPADDSLQIGDTADLTKAAAAIIGPALKGSIESIEQLGVPVDRKKLMDLLGNMVIEGRDPDYGHDDAYSIIDKYVAENEQAYFDKTFSPESQKAFIDEASKEDGAVVTASGLVFTVKVEGEGPNPAAGDRVAVMYVARLSDGTVFDETDTPETFDVDRLVPGFTEGLKLMRQGGKYRLVIPADLAYGEEGVPGSIPPNAALDFAVELLQVLPVPTEQ